MSSLVDQQFVANVENYATQFEALCQRIDMIELEMENLKKHHANLLLSQKINIQGKQDKEVMVGSPQFLQNRLKTEVDQLMNEQVFTKAPKDWFSESQHSENVSNFSENLHCRRSAVYIKHQSDVSNSQEKENLPTSQSEIMHDQPKCCQTA